MTFSFINQLCESKLFSSRPALDKWSNRQCADAAYWYLLALQVLVNVSKIKEWAKQYCGKSAQHNDFDQWRSNGNDLYTLLYALSDKDDTIVIVPVMVRDWLRNPTETGRTEKLFNRIDTMLKQTDSSGKAIRRRVLHWEENSADEKHDLVTKVKLRVKKIAPNSELLAQFDIAEKETDILESASAGSTGAAAIATSIGGLGSGFDPDGHANSVYTGVMLRRVPVIGRRKSQNPVETD